VQERDQGGEDAEIGCGRWIATDGEIRRARPDDVEVAAAQKWKTGLQGNDLWG